MATAANLVTLVVAFLGLSGVMLTQYFAHRREDVRWSRERDREEAAWAREDAARSYERTQQRLAESYLEVLRIVEREGQWVDANVTNWKIGAEEQAVFGVDPDFGGRPGFERVRMPEPAVTDRAIIAAHLAAFGSAKVRGFHDAWRSTIAAIDDEQAKLRWNMDQSYPEGPSLDELKPLQDVLHPNEVAARQALADAIAEKLGHR